MTALLERAIGEAAKLPEQQQQAIATLILDEIASETRWNEQFAGSQDLLARLGADALREFERGETKPLRDDRDLSHD